MGMVVDFGTPCTHTAVLWVFHGYITPLGFLSIPISRLSLFSGVHKYVAHTYCSANFRYVEKFVSIAY
jgi:hypothetical protein